jgi:cobalt-zinc-cadmium efflux system outer membrane protein
MVWLPAGNAAAQVRTWTLTDVLARARAQAPQIVSARLAVDEARGQVLGASVRHQSNPDLNLQLGYRNGERGRFADLQVGVRQTLDPGPRRTARMDGANALVEQGTAGVDETTRTVLRSAAASYFRALHATARIRLLDRAQELAAGVYDVADRRFRAGDIAVLDVNLARAALARTRADREAAEAARALALGDLRQVLLLRDEMAVDGELTAAVDDPDLAALLQSATERPELRALEAAVREAEADVRLGLAATKATYGVGAQYSREEGDQIVLGGLTITLPTFTKGQELRAVGAARATRLRAELDAARTRIQLEVQTALEAYRERRAAVRVLEAEALTGLDDSDALTTRSFDVGQISLPQLLLVRREFLDTRFHHLDALLEAALARVDVDASAGILR